MQLTRKFIKEICFLLCVIDIFIEYTWVELQIDEPRCKTKEEVIRRKGDQLYVKSGP